jgi:hypothetical protein
VTYNPILDELTARPSDCNEPRVIICHRVILQPSECFPSYGEPSVYDIMLNPKIQKVRRKIVEENKHLYKYFMNKVDKTVSYKILFSSLWYAPLPCYDIEGITSVGNGENGVLRYCEWKGVAVPCEAIFNTFPTDFGMCCSFNMKAADEIFKGEKYPQLVKSLQEWDNDHSIGNSTIPDDFATGKEPKTSPGRNKGLMVVLDGHFDNLEAGSVPEDFQGFYGFIGSNRSFPLMSREGFEILAGM